MSRAGPLIGEQKRMDSNIALRRSTHGWLTPILQLSASDLCELGIRFFSAPSQGLNNFVLEQRYVDDVKDRRCQCNLQIHNSSPYDNSNQI